MAYDPFARGPHVVGVSTEVWTDDERDRPLTVEVWYPADAPTNADLDPATQDAYPPVWSPAPGELVRQAAVRDADPAEIDTNFVLFSHGYAGFRREATFICTHLASHGYVVASADHTGSASDDVDAFLADPESVAVDPRITMANDRLGDVPFLIADATERGYARGPVGVCGISLGGWTTLSAPAVEPRVAALAALCPAGGRSPALGEPNPLRDLLGVEWGRPVPTLQMVADRDAWLPLYGQFELLDRVPGPARMVILRNADHNHFVDDIPTSHTWYREITTALAASEKSGEANWAAIAESIAPIEELVDPDTAYALWRGLTVAQFDAHLRKNLAARELLTHGIRAAGERLGGRVFTLTPW